MRDAVNMETLFALAADHRRILAISSGGARPRCSVGGWNAVPHLEGRGRDNAITYG
ncbi:MAG: hypothetical protein IPO61_05660 [Gammaproteobacteria bacterium]|nr:hypothetical protein [Gammaproteobacteria bacterium]